MSCYPVCPTCGRMLADKEYYFKTQKEIIENKDLTQDEYKKEFDKLWEELKRKKLKQKKEMSVRNLIFK